MLEMHEADQTERSEETTKVIILSLREESEIPIRPDITRYSRAREDGASVWFSHFHHPPPSVCVCDLKEAKVFSVLLITGADIHIRPDIRQNAQNVPDH